MKSREHRSSQMQMSRASGSGAEGASPLPVTVVLFPASAQAERSSPGIKLIHEEPKREMLCAPGGPQKDGRGLLSL